VNEARRENNREGAGMSGPGSAMRGRLGAYGVIAGLLLLPLAGGEAWASSSETARCIRDPRCHRTFVVAHRAKGLGAPENSRAAVARAVQAGVPLVKIDVRASRDGDLFVLHDGKLDRTTNLTGRIETVSSAELRNARLENGETLPSFAELYAIGRGKLVMTIGFKVDVVERIADWIHAEGSFDDLIFFVNTGEEMIAAARARKRYPQMIVMVRLLDTRVTVDSTRAVFGGLPEILHTELVGAKEVSSLQAQGAKVYVDATPVERYIPPFNYFAIRSLIKTRLDFFQTDEPLSAMRRMGQPR
jgi:glycerophosphoryl diester phosphodiesterase